MSYEGKCGSCANLEDRHGAPFDPRYSYPAKGYCTWYHVYCYPDEDCDGKHYRPRSYITTMVCMRLGLDPEDNVYKTITNFQTNVMEKDEQYAGILGYYDFIGPKISRELEDEELPLVKSVYNNFLVPVSNLINEHKEDQAIRKYRNMIEILRGYYGISREDYKPRTYSRNKFTVLAIKKNI